MRAGQLRGGSSQMNISLLIVVSLGVCLSGVAVMDEKLRH